MKQGRSLREAKAQQAAKKRRARRRKRATVLIVELLIFIGLLGVGYVMKKYDKLQLNFFQDGDIVHNDGVKQKQYRTVALFGGDSREGELGAGTHADTIMIVSIDEDTREVKILSVFRDLLTVQSDGEIRKANSAYFKGGPKDAVNMLNRNFDLDIEDYVTVDFAAMANAVDLLGGIEIDVTDAEAAEVNRHIVGTSDAVGKKANFMRGGQQVLDGVQAVTYARIRKNVGGDYGRTERQRLVVQKMVEKIKDTDLATINKILDEVFPQISTSFTLKELVGLASGVLQYNLGETAGYAFDHTDGTIKGIGSVVVPVGVLQNVEKLHQFLYPRSEYTPSETVKNIASQIEELSGNALDK